MHGMVFTTDGLTFMELPKGACIGQLGVARRAAALSWPPVLSS